MKQKNITQSVAQDMIDLVLRFIKDEKKSIARYKEFSQIDVSDLVAFHEGRLSAYSTSLLLLKQVEQEG